MRGYFYHATVQRIKKDYGVKKGMVITEDQQGMKYVPCADFTMHYKLLSVEWGVTDDGHILPPTVVYGGQTKKVVPKAFKEYKKKLGWHAMHTKNHWCRTAGARSGTKRSSGSSSATTSCHRSSTTSGWTT